MRFFAALFIIGTLSGCVSSPVKFGDYSTVTAVDSQRLGEIQTQQVGSVLASKGIRTLVPALQLTKATAFNKAEDESSIMTCALTALAGTYPKRGEFKENSSGTACYGPVTVQLTLADGTTNWNCPGQSWLADVCHDLAGNYFIAVNATKAPLKQQFENIRHKSIPVEGQTNLVQELIYEGRSGDLLNFTYREFTADTERPSFAQGLQVNIGSSRSLTYRSLHLDIMDVDAESVTYRLVSGFDGD